MDSQLSAALIALGVTVVGALGTLVTLLVERVKRDLAANTKITKEAKEAANGRLTAAQDELAEVRNRVVALRALVRERDDRLAYLTARLPDVPDVLRGYEEHRQTRHTEAEELAAMRRALEDPIE